MKVHFSASITGQDKYSKHYQKIVDTLKELGVEILSDHVISEKKEDVLTKSKNETIAFYKKQNDWINKSDIVIIEASFRSTALGHELSIALKKNKPLIILYVKGKKTKIFDGLAANSDKVQLVSYDLDNLKQTLKHAIDYAQDQQDTRFNFFISPKHQSYLDWIAKNRKIPRSVYLRNLIEKNMAENEKYQG